MKSIWKALFLAVLLTVPMTTARADRAPAATDNVTDHAKDAVERGNQAFALGHYELAIFEYQGALSVSYGVQAAQAQFNIGVCQHRLGRLTEAIASYRAAIKTGNGNYPKASFALGLACRESGQWAEAKAAFHQAALISGKQQVEALFELGLLHQREGAYQAAAECFRKAINKGDKLFPAAHNNLGIAFFMAGQMEEALQEFDLAHQQSKGRMTEAEHNLRLCRAIIEHPTQQLIARLKPTELIQSFE